MLKVETQKMELRGIANATSKNGNVYYYINAESEDGTAYQFYCPNADVFPQGLKKGDKVKVTFDYGTYKGNVKLTVSKLDKVD